MICEILQLGNFGRFPASAWKHLLPIRRLNLCAGVFKVGDRVLAIALGSGGFAPQENPALRIFTGCKVNPIEFAGQES